MSDLGLKLGAANGKPFEVDANIVATGRTAVIGSSGSGKSYAVGVLCEELCKQRVPFAIIDVEGEYAGLKEKYDAIRLGEDKEADLHWFNTDLARLASQAPDIAPLILDVSEAQDAREKISVLLTAIYIEVSRRRTPYTIIVEEADRFFPQKGEALPIFSEIARRGRKRGVGLVLCTQRPALVDKSVLSQCSNQLLGKLNIKNDLQAVAQFFQGQEVPAKRLTTATPGEFYAMGGLAPTGAWAHIRQRETTHLAATPTLEARRLSAAAFKEQTKETLQVLQRVTMTPEEVQERERALLEASVPQKTYRAKFKAEDAGVTQLIHARDPPAALEKAEQLAGQYGWEVVSVTETRHRWMPSGLDGTEGA